jgi:COMPASS component SWD2
MVKMTGIGLALPDRGSNRKLILITTNGAVVRLIDAFQGQPIHSFVGHMNAKGQSLEACFSPDAQFVFSGLWRNSAAHWLFFKHLFHLWVICPVSYLFVIELSRFNSARTILTSERHTGAIYCCQFNPKYVQMVTSCQNMAFWLPEDEETADTWHTPFWNF